MPQAPQKLNIYFRLVVLSAALFVLTVLISITSLLGDGQSAVSQYLESHGSLLMCIEVFFILFFGAIAMRFDNSPILRNQEKRSSGQDESDHFPKSD